VAEILAESVDAVGREERSAPAGHGQQHHQPPQHHESPPHHKQPPQHHDSFQHHKRSAPQISQSCSGAHCNQNNVLGSSTGFFGSIAQNCANGACNQNNVASSGHAGAQFSGPLSQVSSISQNCANGACNQNNVLNGRRKREVIAQLIEEARKIAEEEVEVEEAISRKKRQISQNIVNGIGIQNNVASGGHAGAQFSGPAFQFPSISQNCANGVCNQNNVLGRRKREIIAAILDESS